MNITTDKNIEKLQQKTASYLGGIFSKYKDAPLLFLSSGGSALNILSYTDSSLLASNSTVSVLDERFSSNPDVSNFSKLHNTEFYRDAVYHGAHSISTIPLKHETLFGLADRFDTALKNWKSKHVNGKVIATIGLGSDGHTAGVMPYPDDMGMFNNLFENSVTWVIGYNARGKNEYPERMTVTLPFLREHIDHAVVFVVGEEKRRAFEKVMDKSGLLHITPARIIREMKDTNIFTTLTN